MLIQPNLLLSFLSLIGLLHIKRCLLCLLHFNNLLQYPMVLLAPRHFLPIPICHQQQHYWESHRSPSVARAEAKPQSLGGSSTAAARGGPSKTHFALSAALVTPTGHSLFYPFHHRLLIQAKSNGRLSFKNACNPQSFTYNPKSTNNKMIAHIRCLLLLHPPLHTRFLQQNLWRPSRK